MEYAVKKLVDMCTLGSGEFADRNAEIALANHYGVIGFERSVVDGQAGYTVTLHSGTKFFHFRLGTAIRQMLIALGHGEDRDVLVIGEPEVGNAWMVRK